MTSRTTFGKDRRWFARLHRVSALSGVLKADIRHQSSGMALVVMLAILLMITVLVVALLTLAAGERSSANLALQRAQAEALADIAADLAMDNIATAIAQGSQPGKTWASEPGRITVFNIDSASGAITRQGYDLFSALATADNQVDLNEPSISGQFPIAPPVGNATSATMKVGWQNILRDPSQPASETNQIIGRIAYWVDDESCKVNINTADGSRKGNDGHYGGFPTANPTQGYSFGFGTPSEISLAALPGMDQTKARAIADTAWIQEFNSAEEIVRAKDSSGNQAVTRPMYEAIRFDVTHFNSSPDLNFMGEPRLALNRSVAAAGGTPRQNASLGRYELTERQRSLAGLPPAGIAIQGLTMEGQVIPMDQSYPQPSQLPRPAYLPHNKMFLQVPSTVSQLVRSSGPAIPDDYYFGSIIANYLAGTNLRGNSFTWPAFAGSSNQGFVGKYSLRQIDSITLQILDTAGKALLTDHVRAYSMPGIIEAGWLSGKQVIGIGRSPRLTEILFTASSTLGDPFNYGGKIGNPNYSYPLLRLNLVPEYYYPSGFRGMPNYDPFESASHQWRYYGVGNSRPSIFNFYDYPDITLGDTAFKPIGPGVLGSAWTDVILTVTDQNGNPAGINFAGPSSLWDDPDQAKAALYHPFTQRFSGNGTIDDPWVASNPPVYSGSVYQPPPPVPPPPGSGPRTWGALEIPSPFADDRERGPGTYTSNRNRYPTTDHPARPDATELNIRGGVQVWIRNETGTSGYRLPLLSPFESALPELNNVAAPYGDSLTQDLKQMVIPVNMTVPVPGNVQYLVRVADPLVNQFPGDWEGITDPPASEITMRIPNNANSFVYKRGGAAANDPFFVPNAFRPENLDGDNPGFRPSGGGDPLSIWLPPQDPRIPKQARFPSVGALFSLRTGVFPDKNVENLSLLQQRGVPFRALNMAPSTHASQATAGGTSYPDWAMLDLFHVPFLPYKPYGPGTAMRSDLPQFSVQTTQPFRRLTYGGATVGRININNPPVPYPFAEDPAINSSPPRRHALEALFFNLKPSNSYAANGDPIYTTIDAAAARSLAEGVAAYQKSNGPFFMAGEIANVPEVANFLYTFSAQTSGPSRSASVSRNDLVRDTVGAITTRSNTFSVWVVAQTIRKKPGNVNWGGFEPGDIVTSEVRRRYMIERFIDTGVDGVPGNAVSPAFTGIPNTFSADRPQGDDTNSSAPIYHPAFTYPINYRWRVLAVENFQL
jgi:hypothetical protein